MWSKRRETSPEEKTHPENSTSTDLKAQQGYSRYSPSTNYRGPASGEDWCTLNSTLSGLSSHFSPAPSNVYNIADFIDYPDGGLQAWLQVFVATPHHHDSLGLPNQLGVYQFYYLDTLKLPSDIVPWIGSAQAFLAFALCTISGIMADMRLVRLAMTFGCVLVVIGTLLTSIICGSDTSGLEKVWGLLLSQGIITGIGLGFCYMPPLSVANSYFSEQRRPFALAVAATGTGIGIIVFILLVQYLTPVIGFQWTVRCQAFVVLAMSVVAVAVVKPRLKLTIGNKSWDWEMFKDWPYQLFIYGACLFFLAIFFTFFCVSVFHLPQPHHPRTQADSIPKHKLTVTLATS